MRRQVSTELSLCATFRAAQLVLFTSPLPGALLLPPPLPVLSERASPQSRSVSFEFGCALAPVACPTAVSADSSAAQTQNSGVAQSPGMRPRRPGLMVLGGVACALSGSDCFPCTIARTPRLPSLPFNLPPSAPPLTISVSMPPRCCSAARVARLRSRLARSRSRAPARPPPCAPRAPRAEGGASAPARPRGCRGQSTVGERGISVCMAWSPPLHHSATHPPPPFPPNLLPLQCAASFPPLHREYVLNAH